MLFEGMKCAQLFTLATFSRDNDIQCMNSSTFAYLTHSCIEFIDTVPTVDLLHTPNEECVQVTSDMWVIHLHKISVSGE